MIVLVIYSELSQLKTEHARKIECTQYVIIIIQQVGVITALVEKSLYGKGYLSLHYI